MVSGIRTREKGKRKKEIRNNREEKADCQFKYDPRLNDHHLCESSTLEYCTHSTGEYLHTSLVSLVYGNEWRDVSAIIGASERLRSEMQTLSLCV